MDEVQQDLLAKAIGGEIRAWRQRKGLTQEALAQAISKGKNTIQRYESGETMPDVVVTFRIAEALDVPVSKIIDRAEDVYRIQSGYALAADKGDDEPFDDEPGEGA